MEPRREGVFYSLGRGRVVVRVGVGAYSRVEAHAPCGLVHAGGLIGGIDDPAAFLSVERATAELVWFRTGFVEYRLETCLPQGAALTRLAIRGEICSDAPGWSLDWPSDVVLRVNAVDVCTLRCDGDYGGRRGRHTPSWWPDEDTQFGKIREVVITDDGTTVDGLAASRVGIAQLGFGPELSFRFSVPPATGRGGGLNLFGADFGDSGEAMTVELDHGPSTGRRLPAPKKVLQLPHAENGEG